jgi:excisionase family DNA binding protein
MTDSRPRFLTMDQVSEQLNVSAAQTYALLRTGALRAIKIGGRGQWRIAQVDVESYIEQAYRETQQFIQGHPWGADEATEEEGE